MASPRTPGSGRGRREGGGLPEHRGDACATTQLRWLTFYAAAVKARVAALNAAAAEDDPGQAPDPWQTLQELLPLLHSVCQWVSVEEACAWLQEQTGVRLHPPNLRMALRRPADAWAILWRDIQQAVWSLARTFRVSADDLLWEEHLFARLRGREAQLSLGNLERTRAALGEIARARVCLEERWFALEPRTRACARQYIGLVTTTARAEDDF